jgi:PadR family transcriptional regulator
LFTNNVYVGVGVSGREYLGEFELVVLLALARLGDAAYGASIHREILDATGRDVSIPAVYVTLKRMQRKGLVASSLGSAGGGGGRPTRNYRVLPAGEAAIARSRVLLERLWDGLGGSVAEGPAR